MAGEKLKCPINSEANYGLLRASFNMDIRSLGLQRGNSNLMPGSDDEAVIFILTQASPIGLWG